MPTAVAEGYKYSFIPEQTRKPRTRNVHVPLVFSFLPSIQSGPSASMIEPLTFRVDFPSSFKSVGKCLPSHMQVSRNPDKLSMKINHPWWLRSNPHCGRTLPCAPMSCVPSIRTECPILPNKGFLPSRSPCMNEHAHDHPLRYPSPTALTKLSLVDVVVGPLKIDVSRANEIHHVRKWVHWSRIATSHTQE